VGTGPKVALAVAAVTAAVVLLVLLRPGDEDDEAQPTTQATTVVTTTVTETTGETTTTTMTTEEEVVRAEIVVEGGDVSGPERVELEQGQRLVLVVRADVTDEVHVHGYDLMKDVSPGQPARFNFRVTDPGRFDVELEQRQQPLTELVVSP
jgi:heme/copper-type cytochrome/quinol oxidase subunit 2